MTEWTGIEASLKEKQQFAVMVERVYPHSNLVGAYRLAGGVSAQVVVLVAELPGGQVRKMILRQHGAGDLRQNPQIAADEFSLLGALHAAGLPVPQPWYLDQSGEVLSTPYLIAEYIEGKTEFTPLDSPACVQQLATCLTMIHKVDASRLAFLPRLEEQIASWFEADTASHQQPLFRTLRAAWPWFQPGKPSLLHGDYWPGNVLWRDGRLAGVIDWEDAKLGDPLADLANSRLEILWGYGIDSMHSFTLHYQSMMCINLASLPYWDLWAALRKGTQISRWGLDEAAEQKMRVELDVFVHQALERVNASASSRLVRETRNY